METAAAVADEEDDIVEFLIPPGGWSFGKVHEIPKRIVGKQKEIIPAMKGGLSRGLVRPEYLTMRKLGRVIHRLATLPEEPEEEPVPEPLVVQPKIGSHLHRPKTIYPPQLYADIQNDSFEPIIIDRFPVVTNEIPEEGAVGDEAPETVTPYANALYRFEDGESRGAWGGVYPDHEIIDFRFADEEMARILENASSYPRVNSRSNLRITRDERAASANADARVARKTQKHRRHRQQLLFCPKCSIHRDFHGVHRSERIDQPAYEDFTSDPGTGIQPPSDVQASLIAMRAARGPESFQYVTARSKDRTNRMIKERLEAHAMHDAMSDNVVTRQVSTRRGEATSRTGGHPTTRSEEVVTRQLSSGRRETTSRTGRHPTTRSEEELTRQVSTRREENTSRIGRHLTARNEEVATRGVSTKYGGPVSRKDMATREVSTRRRETTSRAGGQPITRSEEVVTRQISTTRGETTSRIGRPPTTRSEEAVTRQISTRRGESASKTASHAAPGRQISSKREEVISRTEGRTTTRGKVSRPQSIIRGERPFRYLKPENYRPPWR